MPKMLRLALFLVCAAIPLRASAQTADGRSAEPSKEPPRYEITVAADKPSPAQTQDRLFTGTRFWLLDPGRFEVETWWDHQLHKGGGNDGLLQLEVEIGLAPHLQLDLYQNFTVGDPGFGVEGNQIELRYSFARTYNQIPLNPVLYLEWHPRHHAQDRAEARLLLGGDIGSRVVWAANVYAELNVDGYNAESSEGKDMEAGVSAAASYAVVPDLLRLGGEIMAGVDQHGAPQFAPVTMIGPNVLLKVPNVNLKLTATAFFGVQPKDPQVRMLLIAGYGF